MKFKINLILVIFGFTVTSYCNDFQPDWEGVDWKEAFRIYNSSVEQLLGQLRDAVNAHDVNEVESILKRLDLGNRYYLEDVSAQEPENPEYHLIMQTLKDLIKTTNNRDIRELLMIEQNIFLNKNLSLVASLYDTDVYFTLYKLEKDIEEGIFAENVDRVIKFLQSPQIKRQSNSMFHRRIQRVLERYKEYKQSRGACDQAGPA